MRAAIALGEVMSARPLLIVLIFLASMAAPFSDNYLGDVSAEDALVCCDTADVELYLLGSASAGTLSPFSQDLSADTSSSAAIAGSVTSEESVGKWVLPNVWPGTVPANTWKVSIEYELTNAASAQINATASLKIGSQTYSASTEPGSSVLAQGTGTLTFDIEVDATSVSDMGAIELSLTARSLVFTIPTGDAQLEFLWGSEDADSHVEAEIPLFDLTLLEPEIEGSDVYFSVLIDSNWGMDLLSKSDSLQIFVAGTELSGDPIETGADGAVRVTWTWQGAKGGTETVSVEARLTIESGGQSLSGSTTFEIETFDTSGGTGTYYPPDEPLKTNGDGSPISVSGTFTLLKNSEGVLQLDRTTRIEIGGEMAFWMRWGMDHIGDEVTTLSPVLKSFDAGSVGDDERVSRDIEQIEVMEMERQLLSASGSSGLLSYYLSVGLGLEVEELLGGSVNQFLSRDIDIELNGESQVVNHPVTLIVKTVMLFDGDDAPNEGERIELIGGFITAQPTPLWGKVSLSLVGKSSAMTSFAFPKVVSSNSVTYRHFRMPWGETLTLEGSDIAVDDYFAFKMTPSNSLVTSPGVLSVLTLFALFLGFMFALAFSRSRRRGILLLELILIPLVGVIHWLAYPSVFVGGSAVTVVVIWWVTAVTSPRKRSQLLEQAIKITTPVINCPACSTPNPVESQERPLRFACVGCQRVIRIEA
ncbi:MAG: hypothetical protein P8R00_00875 [Candidatus Poseidoniaceae archaeon]|nr:hypothetical protein [Candidatus Poseidoniaceae archaeon]